MKGAGYTQEGLHGTLVLVCAHASECTELTGSAREESASRGYLSRRFKATGSDANAHRACVKPHDFTGVWIEEKWAFIAEKKTPPGSAKDFPGHERCAFACPNEKHRCLLRPIESLVKKRDDGIGHIASPSIPSIAPIRPTHRIPEAQPVIRRKKHWVAFSWVPRNIHLPEHLGRRLRQRPDDCEMRLVI